MNNLHHHVCLIFKELIFLMGQTFYKDKKTLQKFKIQLKILNKVV